MGQIVSLSAKPKRCNANQLSQVPTPAAGEYILVSSDNSMNAAGQGNFDCYIVGDGTKAATALELKQLQSSKFPDADVQVGEFAAGYYNTKADTLPTNRNTANGFQSAKLSVSVGETYKIYGMAANSDYYRLYAFYDSVGARIDRYASSGNYRTTPFTIQVPTGAVTMVVNMQSYDATTDKLMKGGDMIDVIDLAHDVEDIEADLQNKISYDVLTEEDLTSYVDTYIKYTDGTKAVSASTSQHRTWVVPCAGVTKIKATLAFIDTIPAAIAFYSSAVDMSGTTIGAYMQSSSLQASIGISEYETNVPDGALYAVLSNRGDANPNPQITILRNPDYTLEAHVNDLENSAMLYDVNDMLPSDDYRDQYYIRYSDGYRILAGTTHNFKLYYFPVAGIAKIKATLGSLDNIPAAIAFFSSEIDLDSQIIGSYMKSASVQAEAGVHEYEAYVPSSAKWVCITSRNATYGSPAITFYGYPWGSGEEGVDALDVARDGYAIHLFSNAPNMYHFAANGFVRDGAGHDAIASESVEDVALAARLGFKFIEANVQPTLDGYVCIHGTNGAFGPEVKSVDESVITTADLRTTAINSVTNAWIRANVRYASYYEKYQTTIPTLEEFCEACKENSIGIFAGTGQKAAVEICIKYLGNNVIIYNPPEDIRDYFNGYVLHWNNTSGLTISGLLGRARTFGAPYICSIGPTTITEFKNNDILDDFVETMHANGFLCGFAGVYQSEEDSCDLIRRGFDFSGSGHMVNSFDSNYEEYDIDDANHLPTTTGTISNGVATLTNGQTITCGSTDTISVGKGNLFIRFNGTIVINFGSLGSRSAITSDGSKMLNISDYFFGRATRLTIEATANATITHLVYKTSRC